jgi:hypothetical protein
MVAYGNELRFLLREPWTQKTSLMQSSRNKSRVELNPTCDGRYLQFARGARLGTAIGERVQRWREGKWNGPEQVWEWAAEAGKACFEGPEVNPWPACIEPTWVRHF